MTNTFTTAYARLNPAQKNAVDTIEGPVVVTAGPGTGKTQMLTLRIANILQIQGADMAENILALTFTNAGAFSMRQRLAEFIGSQAYRVNIFTFHSFAEALIKKYPDYFPAISQGCPATELDQIKIIEDIVRSGSFKHLKTFASDFHYTKAILASIGKLKQENLDPDAFRDKIAKQKETILADEDSYYKRAGKWGKAGDMKKDVLKPIEKNHELADVYQAYNAALAEAALYDFADMLLVVVTAMETDADLLYQLQEQYQYLLVDEHQDTNPIQNRIIDLLTSAEHLDGRANVFTVGDDKQAIYRFQGASVENFAGFKDNYRDVVEVHLETNYRSSQAVLDSAHNLITTASEHQTSTQLASHQASQDHGIKPQVAAYTTARHELHGLTAAIQAQLDSGVAARDIAVIYRENRTVEQLKTTLAKADIPYAIFSRQNLLEDKDIQKLLLLLRSIHDLGDNQRLAQCLYIDFLQIPAFDILKLCEKLRYSRRDSLGVKNLFKILGDAKAVKDLKLQADKQISHLADFLSQAKTDSENQLFLDFFESVVRESGFLDHILALPNSAVKLGYLDTLFGELRKLCYANKDFDLTDFVEYIDVLERYEIPISSTPLDTVDGVRLLTAHGSKGLEFDHVYIVNVVDKVWGNKTSRELFKLPVATAAGDNADERRLFYVALTRAKQSVTISYASQDLEDRERNPSQFLFEIDPELVETIDTTAVEADLDAQPATAWQQTATHHAAILDDEIIRQTFAKRALSVTAINNYLACPARYFFQNLMQLPSAYSKILTYGNLVHASLEQFFNQSKAAGTVLDEAQLLQIFDQQLAGAYVADADLADLQAKGHESLSAYYQHYSDGFSLDVETEFRINGVVYETAGGDQIRLTGVLDRVDGLAGDLFGGATVRVVDYKTGKPYSQKKTKDQKAALDRQIVFYKLLLGLYREGQMQMSEAVLDFVEPLADGGFEQKIYAPSDDDVARLREEIDDMVAAVMAGGSFVEGRCGKKDCEGCRILDNIS